MKEFLSKNKKILIIAAGLIVVAVAAAVFLMPKAPPPVIEVVTEKLPEVYVEPPGLYSCRANSDCVAIHRPEKCDCNHGGQGYMAINKDNKEYYERFNPPPTNEGCESKASENATCKPNPKVECYKNRCYAERGVDEMLKTLSQANVPAFERLADSEGVSLDSTDREGRGVLYYAAINNGRESENLRTIQLLVSRQVPVEQSLFAQLVKNGRLVTADYFVQETKMPKTIDLATFVELFDPKDPAKIKDLEEKRDFLLRNGFSLANFTEADMPALAASNPNAVLYLEKEGDIYKLDKEKKEKKEALMKLFRENPVAKIQRPDADAASFKMLINIYEAAANEMPYEIANHYKSVLGYIVEPLSDRVRLNSSLSNAEKEKYNALVRNIRPVRSDKIYRYFDCRKPFLCWRKKVYLVEGGTSFMWQPFCQNGCYYDISGEAMPTPSDNFVPISSLQEFNEWASTNSIIGDDAPAAI